MGTITYDPILEVQDLRRIRMFTPVASPRLGTALVLEPTEGGPLVILAGERVPEPRIGNYRRSFLIDLGQYGLRLEEKLPSADPAFLFDGSVTFSCRVADPALVATRNIRDVTESVRLPLVRIMRTVARRYDISQFNEAESALNDALTSFTGDAAVYLSGYLMELFVGGEAAAVSSTTFYDVTRDARLDGIRRRDMREVIAGGPDELVAQLLAKHGGDPSAWLEHEAESRRVESEHLLRAMGILTSAGDDSEPFDTKEERRRLLGNLLKDHGSPAVEMDRPVRRRRISGSLATAGPIDSPEPVPATAEGAEPAASRGPEAGSSSPAGGAHRVRSRIRGLSEDRAPRRRDPDADGS